MITDNVYLWTLKNMFEYNSTFFCHLTSLFLKAAVRNLFLLAYPQAEKIKHAYALESCEKAFLQFS